MRDRPSPRSEHNCPGQGRPGLQNKSSKPHRVIPVKTGIQVIWDRGNNCCFNASLKTVKTVLIIWGNFQIPSINRGATQFSLFVRALRVSMLKYIIKIE